MVKIDKQYDGKYTLTVYGDWTMTVKRDLTYQQLIYELEMMPYQGGDG